jgi:hypothetical protein
MRVFEHQSADQHRAMARRCRTIAAKALDGPAREYLLLAAVDFETAAERAETDQLLGCNPLR